MPLAGSVTLRRPIPGETGEWIELRMLGWRALEEARQARQIDALRTAAAAGAEALNVANEVGATRDRLAIASTRDAAAAPDPTPDPKADDPMLQYDLGTLLRHGIVGWSYPEPVTLNNIDRLDEATAKWAGRELIEPVAEPEGKGSNGWHASTGFSLVTPAPQTTG